MDALRPPSRVSSAEQGCTVEVLDELHQRIMSVISLVQPLALDRGYLFWPATGYWRPPDGSHGGGGAGAD